MATPTYTPLATITLSGNQQTVTFASIPTDGTYKDLVIVANLITSANGSNATFKFNGSSADYNQVFLYSNGTSALGDSRTTATFAYLDFASYPRTTFDYMATIQIIDYATTSWHKSFVIRTGNASTGQMEAIAGRWANTSAISSIEFDIGGQTFNTGSTFSLYGIAG